MYGPNWELNSAQGYHPASGIFCDLGNLVVPLVSVRPTPAEVAAARTLILDDLLCDFPFVNQASRANAVAMLLLPLIRPAIDGPTPIGVIDAPAEGTGKSLLTEVTTLATVGEIPEAISPDVNDEEWNKMLLSLLIEGTPIVYLDNANRKLDSASLASAVTARYKRGRILGSTKMARARVQVSWLLTSNNLVCSREIARRCYWTRIDSGVENPSGRDGFRHPDLHGWVRQNRGRLLQALLTLVNNWIAIGRPAGDQILGKFEGWASAMGGILNSAGVDEFLGNRDEFRKVCTDQSGEMTEFVEKWWGVHHDSPIVSGELYGIARAVLESVLTAESEDGRKKQLGKHLRKCRDRVFGDYRICAAKANGSDDRDYAGRQRYQLQQVVKPNTSPVATHCDVEVDGGEFEMNA